VAVGADRNMRFWDSYRGTLLLEHFTGHSQGSSVAAAALSPDNKMFVTADTAGFIMVG
jgi:WD40 repeat protein